MNCFLKIYIGHCDILPLLALSLALSLVLALSGAPLSHSLSQAIMSVLLKWHHLMIRPPLSRLNAHKTWT